jgi:hypothetical protein
MLESAKLQLPEIGQRLSIQIFQVDLSSNATNAKGSWNYNFPRI